MGRTIATIASIASIASIPSIASIKRKTNGKQTRQTLQKHLPTGAQVAGPLVLPEVGGALPDDLRLLRTVPAATWRPNGRPDGAGGSLGKAEHRGGVGGRQDVN